MDNSIKGNNQDMKEYVGSVEDALNVGNGVESPEKQTWRNRRTVLPGRTAPVILVVDDEKNVRTVTRRMLRKYPCELLEAASGEEALAIVRNQGHAIDVILLDIKMPGISGFEVLKALKANPGTADIKVLMVTALADTADKVQAFREGACDYLTKPFDTEELFARIQTHAELKRSEDALAARESFNFSLFQHSPTPTIIVDHSGRVIKCNLAWENSCASRPGTGQQLYPDSSDNGEINMHAELMYCIETGQKKRLREMKCGDRFVTITMTPFSRGAMVMSEDITERRRAEEEVHKNKEALMTLQRELQEIDQRIDERVNERTSRMTGLLEQKEGFINQLANDLQLPLNPLVDLLPILKDMSTNEDMRELAEKAVHSINSLERLVENTAKMTKVNPEDTKPEALGINLSELINDVINSEHQVSAKSDITIENGIDTSIVIDADRVQLMELLQSLMTDAIKSMRDGGTLTIDARENDGCTVVSIRNTAIYITQEQINHMVNEFDKADQSCKFPKSTGMGMEVYKLVVERHYRKIQTETERIGKGSSFCFAIPLKTEGKQTAKH